MLGWALRQHLPHRWLRLHSLPHAKRYATHATERDEILARHRSVLRAMTGGAAELVFSMYGAETFATAKLAGAMRQLNPTPLGILHRASSRLDRDFQLLSASVETPTDALASVLMAVADDLLETPLLISRELKRVAAPYDGGVDLFLESPAAKERFAERFRDWLPEASDL
ncbi:MAG: hypothetical protein AB8I08_27600 [Sandaracinaceae bacterium]